MLTHGQLFGGIFGFGLAAQWAGIRNVWYNEYEHHPCEVVRARIADGSIIDNVKIYEQDIRTIGKHNLSRVDIISGGPPCQPTSFAGNRKGENDDRWLWPEAIRIVSELKPSLAIFENPTSILSLDNGKAFDKILYSLEDEGYEIEIFNISSASIGANNIRERIWIIAYSSGLGWKDVHSIKGGIPKPISNPKRRSKESQGRKKTNELDTSCNSFLQFEQSYGQPAVFGDYDGLPKKLDVNNRLTAIGNAINPKVAYEIFKAIKQIHEQRT